MWTLYALTSYITKALENAHKVDNLPEKKIALAFHTGKVSSQWLTFGMICLNVTHINVFFTHFCHQYIYSNIFP